ncbi:MAG: FhaA domain-containing protein [Armatimonadota bacterium]
MSLLRRLEDALESIIDGGLARVAGGGVHPLEIARRLQDQMAEGKLLGVGASYAPNRFTVRLADEELAFLGDLAEDIAEELSRHLEEYAAEQGWAVGAGVVVRLQGGGRPGRIEVEHSFEESAPGARLVVVAGQADGATFEVGGRAMIGRDPQCEVLLREPAVSRHHAELEWTYRGYLLRDLGSRNGTFVNGEEIGEALLGDGDLIEVGLVQIRFHQHSR